MATDKLFHKYSVECGTSLLRLLDIDDCEEYKAFSFTVKEIERRSDIVFENQRGKERAIWVEFQGYRDEYVFYRMNVAISLYCQERKFNGEILPIVIFLNHSHRQAARMLVYHFNGRQRLYFEPEVIVIRKKSVKELQDLNDVYLIPLYPLCDISPKEIKESAPEWAEEIKESEQLSDSEKNNVLAMLGGFISHRIQKLTLDDINQLLGGLKMEDTQVGKDLIEIGIERGLERGLEKGKRQILFRQLSYKFGEIPQDITNFINSISDETTLDDLSVKIFELTDLDQLKKLLN